MATIKATARALLCAIPILCVFWTPAIAQPACADRSDILKKLSDKYAEEPVSIGLANNGGVIEVLVSENLESWTIIITMPNGPTCLVSAGENWQTVVKSVKGHRL